MLLSLVGFPPSLPFNTPTPQQFALQLWDVPQKRANTLLVVGIIGLLGRHAGVSTCHVIRALPALIYAPTPYSSRRMGSLLLARGVWPSLDLLQMHRPM